MGRKATVIGTSSNTQSGMKKATNPNFDPRKSGATKVKGAKLTPEQTKVVNVARKKMGMKAIAGSNE